MSNEDKNLIVLFPGAGYSVDRPLLYYAGRKYNIKGYEILKINYGDCLKIEKPFTDIIEDIKGFVLNQINDIDFSLYGDILFVSKSLGTVIAGWLSEILKHDNIRHIYLTPVNETLQFIKNGENISIVIAGTADKHLDTNILQAHCEQQQVRLKLIENAGHGLEISGDINKNIDILKQIVESY